MKTAPNLYKIPQSKAIVFPQIINAIIKSYIHGVKGKPDNYNNSEKGNDFLNSARNIGNILCSQLFPTYRVGDRDLPRVIRIMQI